MRQKFLLSACLVALALPLAGCNEQSIIASGEDFGPSPKLVEPNKSLIPTVNVSKAVGWPEGAAANGETPAITAPREPGWTSRLINLSYSATAWFRSPK